MYVTLCSKLYLIKIRCAEWRWQNNRPIYFMCISWFQVLTMAHVLIKHNLLTSILYSGVIPYTDCCTI